MVNDDDDKHNGDEAHESHELQRKYQFKDLLNNDLLAKI